jgi:hypothetical protein
MSKIIPTPIELTILMPCLNEAETLADCIRAAQEGAKASGVADYEILVSDNGSTDGSQDIAKKAGARVVDAPVRGYGGALQAGIEAARGRYIIMADSDLSYDFAQLKPFVEELRAGRQLVMGTRIRGEIHPGAMPGLHRYLGTPVLTFLGNLFFGSHLSDFNCGMRGFDRQAIQGLNLRAPGMEFASEMVIRAALANLSMTEIPIAYHPDGRQRRPYLRTWQDGWRHLRFMLIFSPRWLFVYPGIALAVLGLVGGLALLPGPLIIGGVGLDVHTLLFFATVLVVGVQLILLGVFAQMYASHEGFLPQHVRFEKLIDRFSLGTGLIIGLLLAGAGVAFYIIGLSRWSQSSFGGLDYQTTLRIVIPGTTLVILGVQMFFSSFLISVLSIREGAVPER